MLRQLYIRNFTLIDTLNIKLFPGFSVITGETGAGKSIILGAIGLLVGQRADTKTIKHGTDKCVIEAHFDLSRYGMEDFFSSNDIEYDASDCIIRRELTAAGKSRAFVNDTPVPLALLKELGEKLIDVHSQHQNLLLGKQDFQLDVVDIIAGNGRELDAYKKAYDEYKDACGKLAMLQDEIERNRAGADFMEYQLAELQNANLLEEEQEELERNALKMSHSEEIKNRLFEADSTLSADTSGVVEQLRVVTNALNSISEMMPEAGELAARAESCHIELKDISKDISMMLGDVDFNPAELDRVNARLDRIYDLQKKYHCDSVAALLDFQAGLAEKLQHIANGDEELEELRRKMVECEKKCKDIADILTASRLAAAKAIEKDMKLRLEPLGMPNVRFEIEMNKQALAPCGQDAVAFMFSANKSSALQPVAQVASGGEIARVMLSLKAMVSGAVKLPTIIFDEIDTGVSGKIAEQMAQIMQQMGKADRQVISITHLPQIAALGSAHYKVVKEETDSGTTSRMIKLDDSERVREIAQMLSGSDVTDAAINNAKELLKR